MFENWVIVDPVWGPFKRAYRWVDSAEGLPMVPERVFYGISRNRLVAKVLRKTRGV